MSSTPTATHSLHCTAAPSRALTSDRAALGIFGPKLYSLYINWQTSIENPDQAALYPSKAVWRRTVQAVRNQEVGGIPSAHTFKAFMNTKRVKEQLYMQDVGDCSTVEDGEDEGKKEEEPLDLLTTRFCKHAVHPGNSWMGDVCPGCLITQCIASLDRIAYVWRLVGGPLKPCSSGDPELSHIYHAAKRIWHVEKVRWANLVDVYERCAKEEVSWEEDSLQTGLAIPAMERVLCPKEALKKALRGEADRTEPLLLGIRKTRPHILHLTRPEPEQETLWYLDGISDGLESDKQNENGTNGANISLSPPNKSTLTQRSPSASLDSSTYALPPSPITPCSPPQTPSQFLLHSPPMFGVYFPDDLLSPSSRRSIYYQRSSPSYTPGEHASPAGSVWVDTSFMSDCNYDLLGGTQNEDEEAEEHRKKRNDYANEMLQLRGNDFIDDGMNMVFGEEVEGMEDDWSDESDSDDEEDDLIHTGREILSQKRLPGQVTGLSIQRPVFSFRWQKQTEARETDETRGDATSHEFEDEEVEQAMREMTPEATEPSVQSTTNVDMPMIASGRAEEMGVVSLAGPETQVSPRRRSYEEFNEFGETKEEDGVKRYCH
ncbi:unnamed protein product [Alternaria alternata]